MVFTRFWNLFVIAVFVENNLNGKKTHDNSKLVVGSGFATFDFEYSLLPFQKVLENHTGYSY